METKLAFLKNTKEKKKETKIKPESNYAYLLKDFKDQHSSQFILHVVPLLLSYRFCYKTKMTIRVEVI